VAEGSSKPSSRAVAELVNEPFNLPYPPLGEIGCSSTEDDIVQ
jgi:hypothetical protein